ncbi:bifunctional diaminohydroxyphosphoribosylaminopyrimidine deaminase/5-amino-6-(5-phosphoribosylamino)uracil reductase RibD [Metabacillus herbersteinensis]|uniref:Riboflavin biosynthesis protein RibD n=1 Tax=Metabacillus herbersteinensis TaxID=283816 RepID=A0ABV6GF32_9BACI
MRDVEYMETALMLARQAKGQTSPNPLVGAVVVKDGRIVGMGAHLRAGEPHAEVHAIRMAGEKTVGSTVYVTLEPCSHHGRTPPCADLLIESKVKRVVIAVKDPNPLVAGSGINRLKDAGITVEIGVLQDEARQLNKHFFHYVQTKTPFVTLKVAASLDGKTATSTGESKWITGSEAREDVHHSRAEHDAILVGVNTILKDDPSLTCRLEGARRQPIRLILDTHLRTPVSARVVNDQCAPTWIITGNQVDGDRVELFHERGVKVITLPSETIKIDDLLTKLGLENITSLYVEGGSTVHDSFVNEKAFNEIITYFAPKLIGGKDTPAMIGGKGFLNMEDVLSLTISEIKQIGSDVKIVATPVKG